MTEKAYTNHHRETPVLVTRMDLILALQLLHPGEQVTLGDITRKMGIPEQAAEQ